MPTALTEATKRCHSYSEYLDAAELDFAIGYITEHWGQHLPDLLGAQLHVVGEQIHSARVRQIELPTHEDPPDELLQQGRDVLHEMLEHIRTLIEVLNPDELAALTEHMEALAEHLESDLEWDRLFATPESKAFLAELSREINEAIERGETEEGGFGRL